MISELSFHDNGSLDFLPQAVFRKPLAYFARLGMKLEEGHDDFDEFIGFTLSVNNYIPAVVKHYAGHPEGTMTLYLPDTYKGVDEITHIVTIVAGSLGLNQSDIVWQRRDNPEL